MAAVMPHFPKAVRRSVLIVYWIAIYTLTHMPYIGQYYPQFSNSDKVGHFTVYFGWTAIWWWLLSAGGRRIGPSLAIKIFIGGFCYAVFDETTQAIVGRTPSLYDMLADITGVATALLALSLWQRYHRPKST